jgi:integrase
MSKTLTTVSVRNFRPGRKRREIADRGSPGLYLVVHPSGRKSWALRLRRPNGQSAKVTLGSCDVTGSEIAGDPAVGGHLTLAAARRVAADLHRQRAMGKDIAAEAIAAKRRKKHERNSVAANAFGSAVADYVAHAKTKQRSWVDVGRHLGIDEDLKVIPGGLAERWRDKPVADIDGHDIFTLIEDVRHRGIPGRARRAEGTTDALAQLFHARLSSLFGWLQSRRRIETNPVAGVAAPDGAEARDRVLSDMEVSKLWRASNEVGEPFGAVFKLLMLTGCRLNEIAQMRFAELSKDGMTLHLPAERVKNKRAHDVPLSPLARKIIADVARIAGSPFVFTLTGRTPVSGFSKAKKRLDDAMDIPPWRTHDIRRTVASGLQRLGVPVAVTEKVLNHVSGTFSGIVGVYQRHDYEAERRVALERWSAHIEGIVSGKPAEVIMIGVKRKQKEKQIGI